MTTTAERLQEAKTKIDDARDVVSRETGASPVLVAVVEEFARKAGKAIDTGDERVAVIELEQAGDSAKAAAEADAGLSAEARELLLDAHLSICIAKGKL